MSGPLDAIVFDLGGVLVAHDNAFLYERLASRCGGRASAEAVQAMIADTRWGTGTPIADLHGAMREGMGYDADWDGFRQDWCSHFVLDRSMLAFVHGLARNNRVMLFSNTNREHWEWLVAESGGLLAEFEPYLSHELGAAKPSVAAFRRVAEAARIEPSRAIFFDDVLANVEGARAAGFQAEVFESEAKLASQLEARGVRLA